LISNYIQYLAPKKTHRLHFLGLLQLHWEQHYSFSIRHQDTAGRAASHRSVTMHPPNHAGSTTVQFTWCSQ